MWIWFLSIPTNGGIVRVSVAQRKSQSSLGPQHRRVRLHYRFSRPVEIGVFCVSLRRPRADRMGEGLLKGIRQPVLLYRRRDAEADSYHRPANGIAEAAWDRPGLVYRSSPQGSRRCAAVSSTKTR